VARVWDFVGLLVQFDLGLLTQNVARRPGVIQIDAIWYHRVVHDYFKAFLGVEIEIETRNIYRPHMLMLGWQMNFCG